MTDNNQRPDNIQAGARAEARWLTDLIAMGKMSVAAAIELIAIPDSALTEWDQAAADDGDLAIFLAQAGLFRLLCGMEFMKRLSEPPRPPRVARVIRRSGSRAVRLSLGPAETPTFLRIRRDDKSLAF